MKLLNLLVFLAACGLAWIGKDLSDDYYRSFIAGLAATLTGVAVAGLFVNVYLAQKERSKAAAPLAKLIAPAVSELHNELFVELWRLQFGVEKGSNLIKIYQKNRRNPKAFSPQQRDEIFEVISSRSADLIRVYDVLSSQFSELTQITGWSFDPKITSSALEARLNFAKFATLRQDPKPEQRYEVIEAYLDGEAAATMVLHRLATKIGLKQDQFMGDAT